MTVKIKMSDNNSKDKRLKVAASGGYFSNKDKGNSFVNKYAASTTTILPITKNAQYAGSGANVIWTQPMFFSPLHTPQNWQLASRRREVMQWCRFYYTNDARVAAGVDFYSAFPMNGFKLECKSKKILKYYEQIVKKLDLVEKLNAISHEYFLLGDVFPFLEIECPHCHNKNLTSNNKPCYHPDGTFKSIKIMNPDYIEVKDNPIANKPEYYLIPDEELKQIIQKKEPRSLYNSLPQSLIALISAGQPIPLSNRSISHIKHNASDYGTYGNSLLQRLFTILAYKTKIMTANWIVAERLILPVRIVKIGDKDRPASESDIQDVANQMAAVANDPNLTIVTHHAFEADWIGATGKIHNITQELEQIGKEILDGLMLNQAILNGEMGGYCLSSDTTTLCDSGFKHYWEIDPKKDKVACYNIETKKIEYHLPYEKVVYDYEGEMVHFNTDNIDILVTPNHRMWSAKRDSDEYKFVRAENVCPRARFIGSVDGYDGEYQKSIKIGEEEYSIYDYCKMIGYYVSEGWLREEKRTNRENRLITVGISQSKKGKARTDIENLFNNMFHTHWEEEHQICVHKPGLAVHLKENFGKGFLNKHLSPFVKNLVPECLEIVLEAMINGDGCCSQYKGREDYKRAYYTSSYQLAQDFAEIAFKCGYVVKIREYNKKESTKKYFNKKGCQYITRHQQYVVYISKGFKGRNPTLCSKSKKYVGKEITRVPYKGKIYCFSVPHELFVTMRNGVVTIQGNTSAQVGVEVLIRRLENWRNKLKNWVEEHIFLPIAQMQGFVDEEESKEMGQTIHLYPSLVFNDLQLRDKSNRIQTLMQMYDKGLVSAQTILEEMDLDYDSEVEKIRDEQVMASSTGQLGAGPQGGNLGTMGMGAMMGGGGGMPPDVAGEPPGGVAGGMGGPSAVGGGVGGAGGASPTGGASPMGAAASSLPKIGKRGSKSKEQEQEAPPPKIIKLTSLEQKMYKTLVSMNIPYELFGQYSVHVPGEQRPFSLDFAYPKLGVGLECLHPDTYVPTIEGVKKAEDINEGEHLIGREGRPVKITKKIVNNSNGKLFYIKAMGINPIRVTGNHPFLISKPKKTRVKRAEPSITRTREYFVPDEQVFVKAEYIEKGDYLVIPKNRQVSEYYEKERLDLSKYRGRSYNSNEIPMEVDLDEDFGWLMGIYAAEGCSCGTRAKVVEFSFHIDEVEYSDKVRFLLEKIFNLKSSESINVKHNCRKVICCCSSLGRFLIDSFGHKAPNKKVPYWMFEAPYICKEKFMEAFCQGDGCVRKESGINRYISSSQKFLIDLQAISFSIGKFATIFQSKDNKWIASFIKQNGEITRHSTHGLWEMDMNPNGGKNRIYREDDDYFYVPVVSIKEEEYYGPVINFEVRGKGLNDHTYLVHNIVTHNCNGSIWHDRPDFQQRDMNRDQKLANIGWRILRFKEEAIDEYIDAVKDVIYKNLVEAEKALKKSASLDEQIMKYASTEFNENPLYNYLLKKECKIGCNTSHISDYIQVLYIGEVDNGKNGGA